MSRERQISQEELKLIAEAVENIFDAMGGLKNTDSIMITLATCTSMVLCSGMNSAKEASEEFAKFQVAVGKSVEHAVNIGMTMWDFGSTH